jgi:hypothetical protein
VTLPHLQRRQGFLCVKKAAWINDFSTKFDRVDGFLQINEEEAQVVLDLRLVHKGRMGF